MTLLLSLQGWRDPLRGVLYGQSPVGEDQRGPGSGRFPGHQIRFTEQTAVHTHSGER